MPRETKNRTYAAALILGKNCLITGLGNDTRTHTWLFVRVSRIRFVRSRLGSRFGARSDHLFRRIGGKKGAPSCSGNFGIILAQISFVEFLN
jgi:hypothetical protein